MAGAGISEEGTNQLRQLSDVEQGVTWLTGEAPVWNSVNNQFEPAAAGSDTNIANTNLTADAARTLTLSAANSLTISGGQTTFKGSGITSGTTALLVENDSSVELFKITDDGTRTFEGTNQTFSISPEGYLNNHGQNNDELNSSYFGDLAGSSVTSGDHNCGFGVGAGQRITSATFNTFIGWNAGNSEDTGTSSVYVGSHAGKTIEGEDNNTFVGQSSGLNITTGSNSVMIGQAAGRYRAGGGNLSAASNSVFIGQEASPSAESETNQIAIGYMVDGNGSNTATWGNNSILNHYFSGIVNLGSYTVATLPTGAAAGMIYVSDETGGATLAFNDGTNWRRVQDRAIVS